MQATPLAPTTTWPSVNPGPVVLLLLLPTIPLLLFGVGARPPNIAYLPFTLGDVYATGALLTCAIAVILGMVVWPEGLSGVMGWVKDGTSEAGPGAGSQPYREPLRGHIAGDPARGGGGARYSRPPAATGHGQYMHQSGPWGGQEQYIPSRQPLPPAPRMDQLTALRTSFSPWYSPSRPHFPTALFVIVVTLAMLLIGVGHVLGAAYDADVSPSSRSRAGRDGDKDEWVKRELSKRKAEKDDPAKTEARVKKEAEKERAEKKARQAKMKPEDFEKWRQAEEARRSKDMAKLRTLLQNEKLPLVALDPPAKDSTKSKSRSRSRDGPDVDDGATRSQGDGGVAKQGIGGGVDEGATRNVGWRNKLKRGIFGRTLAQGLKTESAISPLPALSASSPRAAFQVADPASVPGSVLQSAANAEGSAARLKVEMAR